MSPVAQDPPQRPFQPSPPLAAAPPGQASAPPGLVDGSPGQAAPRPPSLLTLMLPGSAHRSFRQLLKLMVAVSELEHPPKQRFSTRTALLALQLGLSLGAQHLDPMRLRNLFYAALLHNLGNFNPGCPAGPSEAGALVSPAASLVARLPTLATAAGLIQASGLIGPAAKQEGLPLESQLIALCRRFVLLRTPQASSEAAFASLQRSHGGEFAPWLQLALRRLLREEQLWSEVPELAAGSWHRLGLGALDQLLLAEDGGFQLEDVLRVFACLIDAKHRYTYGHSLRVAALARLLCERSGGADPDLVEAAGLLHDVGKLGIPLAILDKPGRLDAQEFDRIQAHPSLSEQLIATIPGLEPMARLARHHHERFDGSGYPDRCAGGEIPLGSRLLAIADSYDAMTSSRAYRSGLGHARAREEITRCAGQMYDPELVAVFRELDSAEIEAVFAAAGRHQRAIGA